MGIVGSSRWAREGSWRDNDSSALGFSDSLA
jgi:hypothetical protein